MSAVHDEVAQAIGHLVMGFNDLEVAAGGAIMRLLKQQERVGNVFVAVPSFSTKLAILKALEFVIDDVDIRKEFNKLLDSAKSINERRNRLIHAQYTTAGINRDSVVVAPLRHAHKHDFTGLLSTDPRYLESFDTDEVMDLVDAAAVLSFKLAKFSEQFNPGGD